MMSSIIKKLLWVGLFFLWYATWHVAFHHGRKQQPLQGHPQSVIDKTTTIAKRKSSLDSVQTATMEMDKLRKPSWEDLWWTTNFKDSSLLGIDAHGMITFPSNIQRVWIEVGVHRKSHLEDLLKDHSDLFLFGFEPALDNYRPCAHERCVNLWAACTASSEQELVTLYMQRYGGMCHSLLRPNTNTTASLRKGTRGCVKPKYDTNGAPLMHTAVPGIPLSALLARIPPHIHVEYIKIDAQGYDLQVMKGALNNSTLSSLLDTPGNMQERTIHRPHVVSLVALNVTDPSKLLYHEQPTLDEIVTYLQRRGWTYVNHTTQTAAIHQVQAFFVSNPSLVYKVASIIMATS